MTAVKLKDTRRAISGGGEETQGKRMDRAWIGSIDMAMKKAYTSRAFEIETNELAKHSQSGIMSETQIVSSAPGNLDNGIRMSTTSEEGSFLEELHTAYQGLGHKERQQVKTLLLTLARATAIYREWRQNDDTSNHQQ